MYRSRLLIAAGLFCVVSLGASADESSARIDELTRQLDALTAEVAQLRKTVDMLNAIRPTITTLMPSVAERFHVMHFAGDAEDWALASHELLGIEHLLGVIQKVDPEKGAMAEGFLAPSLERIDAAIDHGNRPAFDAAISNMVASCNACHIAAGSPAMVVTLDPASGLSLRHSHKLMHSEKPGDHTHTH